MLIDYEAVVADLKRAILAKKSHGQRDLLGTLARLEVAHRLDEGVPERALRLYGVVLSDDLIRSTLDGPRVDGRDDHDIAPAREPDADRLREDLHAVEHVYAGT